MAKVSVIIPIYNAERFIKKALNSLLEQTFQDIEIVCINDCSTDNTLRILNEFAQKDSRIKIINTDKNVGVGTARNIGLDNIDSEFVTFIDADDWIQPTRIGNLYNVATAFNIDIVDTSFTYHRTIPQGVYMHPFQDCTFPLEQVFNWKFKPEYLLEFSIDPWTKLFRTSLIKENNIRFAEGCYNEVLIFAVKSRFYAKRMIYLDVRDYYYRKHSKSIMSQKSPYVENIIKVLDEVRSFLIEMGVFELVEICFNTYAKKELTYAKSRITPDKKEELIKQISEYIERYNL